MFGRSYASSGSRVDGTDGAQYDNGRFWFLINRYPQDDHERLLIEKLKDAGCEVEWGVSECEWVRAEARAHFFETDGENFSTTT